MSRSLQLVLVGTALVVLLAGMGAALNRMVAHYHYVMAETEIGFWRREGYVPDQRARNLASQHVELALHYSPDNPDYLGLDAYRLGWFAVWAYPSAEAQPLAKASLQQQQLALRARPAHLPSYRALDDYQARLELFSDLPAQR